MDDARLRLTAATAVVAPILMLASTIAYLTEGEGMNEGELGGAIQVWAAIAYGIALVGFARMLESKAPRGALVLTVLTLVGVAGAVGYGIDSIQAAVFGTESIQETSSAAAPLALQIPGGCFPLSLVVLGVLLARTATVPAVLGYGLAVGAVLFPASRIPDVEALAVASDGIVLVALTAITASLVRADRPVPQPAT